MIHFLYYWGAELLTFFGYFHKEKNFLGCHQVFFLEVWRSFFVSPHKIPTSSVSLKTFLSISLFSFKAFEVNNLKKYLS